MTQQESGNTDGNTVTAAGARIAGLLDDLVDDSNPDQSPDESAEETSATSTAEEQPDAPADENEDTPDEQSDTDETPEPPAPVPTTVKVTIDGKEEDVPLEELKKGYSRNADYTRKTQALAEERRAQQAAFEAVEQERKQNAALASQLRKAFEQATPAEPDWTALQKKVETGEMDAADFAKTYAEWGLHQKRLEGLRKLEKDAQDKVERDEAEKHRARIAEEHQKLLNALPEWQKDDVRKKDQAELRTYAEQKHGLTKEQFAAIDNASLIEVMFKAMKWDKAQEAAKAKPGPSAAKTPGKPAIVPAKPGAVAPRVTAQQIDTKKAHAALKKSGSVRDAGRALAGLID